MTQHLVSSHHINSHFEKRNLTEHLGVLKIQKGKLPS